MLTNNKLKLIKSLQLRKNRLKHKLFVVEGEKIVDEYLKSNYIVDSIYSCMDWSGEFIKISDKEMKRISSLKNHCGLLAVVKIPFQKNELIGDTILALEKIQDPGNFGTMIRLADWFGVSTIICSEDCVDLYNPKVIQSSMGSSSRVNVIYCNLNEKLLEIKNYKKIAMTLDGDNINDFYCDKKKIILLGNEGKGLNGDTIKLCDYKVGIKKSRKSNAESLNVANACAIALHCFD